MKKIILFSLLILVLLALGALHIPLDTGLGVPLTTIQHKAVQVVSVDANATALAVDTMNWSDCYSLFTPIKPQWNGVSLSFYGYGDGTGDGSPNDATFSFDVYVCDLFGGAECVVSGSTGTIGAQQLSHNPVGLGSPLNAPDSTTYLIPGVQLASDPNTSYCWADDINEGTARWSKDIGYSDYESTNGRAKMKFDRQEAYGIYTRIYDMNDSTVTTIVCVMNGY